MARCVKSVQQAISMVLVDNARFDILDFEFAKLLEQMPDADLVELKLVKWEDE